MKEEAGSAGHPARVPLVLMFLFLLASAGVCWLIWDRYETMLAEAQARQKELDILKERESYLKNLLAEKPCVALEKFRQPPTAKENRQ